MFININMSFGGQFHHQSHPKCVVFPIIEGKSGKKYDLAGTNWLSQHFGP